VLGHGEMFSFQQTTTSLRQIVDAVIPPADTDAPSGRSFTLPADAHLLFRTNAVPCRFWDYVTTLCA